MPIRHEHISDLPARHKAKHPDSGKNVNRVFPLEESVDYYTGE